MMAMLKMNHQGHTNPAPGNTERLLLHAAILAICFAALLLTIVA
jgi:hypothetical protein